MTRPHVPDEKRIDWIARLKTAQRDYEERYG